ncbi:hypothetical protein Tco_0159162 [Tanacetum coccineum]
MAGREVREYTNLTDPKDRKSGKGKDRIDEEDITFQRMVAKMQEVAGERGGYLHGRGALDSDDLLYLKEQMEAEEDAEPASLADSAPASVPLPLRVEPKTKTGIRQQDLLKKVVEVKPKRQKVTTQAPSTESVVSSECKVQVNTKTENQQVQVNTKNENQPIDKSKADNETSNPIKSLLAVYDSSDEDED